MKPRQRPILVIGFGSLLRSDDALGRLAAETVQQWAISGVSASRSTL